MGGGHTLSCFTSLASTLSPALSHKGRRGICFVFNPDTVTCGARLREEGRHATGKLGSEATSGEAFRGWERKKACGACYKERWQPRYMVFWKESFSAAAPKKTRYVGLAALTNQKAKSFRRKFFPYILRESLQHAQLLFYPGGSAPCYLFRLLVKNSLLHL